MGDYVDDRGVGRSFTPAELNRVAYLRQLAKHDRSRVWVRAKASEWSHLDTLDTQRCWRPYPAGAEPDAIIGKRLLPKDVKRIYKLYPEFSRIES